MSRGITNEIIENLLLKHPQITFKIFSFIIPSSAKSRVSEEFWKDSWINILLKVTEASGEFSNKENSISDNDSSFLVGVGGGKSYAVQLTNNQSIPAIQIQGGKIDYVEERDIFG